jgi:phenylacetate-coenzyme A ligase PaaK-like adenylate-forming protein
LSRLLWQAANLLSREYGRQRRYIAGYVKLTPVGAREQTKRALHRFLTYCRTYSPYWRERWPKEAESFCPEEADEVLALLPALSREDLHQHGDRLRVFPEARRPNDGFPAIGHQMEIRSGGSTGVPTTAYTDTLTAARERASRDFLYELCGFHPGDRFFFIWGSPNELLDVKRSFRKRIASALRGTRPVPAFTLTPEKIRALHRAVDRSPSIRNAVCFATAMETILEFAEREGLEFRLLDRVFTGGGLLHARLRQLVLERFSREVFDTYGGRDFGLVAHETPAHDGLQLVEWLSRVEVLGTDGRRVAAGEQGEVHVTQMSNYSNALIRYKTGDTAVWDPNPGLGPLPTSRLTCLSGRLAEVLRGPNDVRLDPAAAIHLVGVVLRPRWLRRFQLVQESAESYALRAQSWDDSVPEQEVATFGNRLASELSNLFRAKVGVRVILVSEIPPLASGKHLYCLRAGTLSGPLRPDPL